jgi:hypothetical protein
MVIEANIWGAFQEVEFEFDTRREPYRLRFHEKIAKKSEISGNLVARLPF